MDFIANLSPHDWLLVILILFSMAAGWQLSRMERQSEALWSLLKEIQNRIDQR